MKYRVENRHRVWDTYDSEEKALEMMRYLNDRYHNDNYIVEVEDEEEVGKATNNGSYSIWLTGSRKTVRRCVWERNGKTYIKWYGDMVEVKRGAHSYYTVEEY